MPAFIAISSTEATPLLDTETWEIVYRDDPSPQDRDQIISVLQRLGDEIYYLRAHISPTRIFRLNTATGRVDAPFADRYSNLQKV